MIQIDLSEFIEQNKNKIKEITPVNPSIKKGDEWMDEEEITKLVIETLEEVGIPYEKGAGELTFNGLNANDIYNYYANKPSATEVCDWLNTNNSN